MAQPVKLQDASSIADDRRLPSQDLQSLWFATLRKPWHTLVVVPADRHSPAMSLARALGEFGGRQRGKPVLVTTTSGLDLGAIANLVADMEPSGRESLTRGGRSIVALDPVVDNPMGIAAAMAADAALLCVVLGRTSLSAARHTIEQIGKEKFIGCVTIEG